MPSAKEIKTFAQEHNLSNAEARKRLIELEKSTSVAVEKEEAPIELASHEDLRQLARNDGTIALGLVVEKKGSGKPSKGLPKLTKKSAIFRVDVSLAEIDQLAETAALAMPGVTVDDFAYILADGLSENAHLENGEQFAAALCGYFQHTESYVLLKDQPDNPDMKGVIIRLIPYKDGYVLRPADYIRSYDLVDQSFAKMKIQ